MNEFEWTKEEAEIFIRSLQELPQLSEEEVAALERSTLYDPLEWERMTDE